MNLQTLDDRAWYVTTFLLMYAVIGCNWVQLAILAAILTVKWSLSKHTEAPASCESP